jgi:hypothetical protein
VIEVKYDEKKVTLSPDFRKEAISEVERHERQGLGPNSHILRRLWRGLRLSAGMTLGGVEPAGRLVVLYVAALSLPAASPV